MSIVVVWHSCQKRHLSNMFSRKCQVQNDRINWEKISCFCQKLDLTLYFTIKSSIFKLRPLFRFLCLINSFYNKYVSCMYNISNISNISNLLSQYWALLVAIGQLFGRYWALSGAIWALLGAISIISAKFGTTEGSPQNTYDRARHPFK